MMDHAAGRVAATVDGVFDGTEQEIRTQRGRDAPAADAACEDIDDNAA
jgi:hypothetical protein